MKEKSNIRITITMVLVMASFILFKWAIAGNLDPTAEPSDSGSAMYTLENIYNRLTGNTTATKRSGGFTEPSATPASTGYTLDEVYNIAIPTQVPKTGQTTSYKTNDDGDKEAGIAVPSTRFTNNNDGTITDNLTGLIWLQNSTCLSSVKWSTALTNVAALANGTCSLSDGSAAGDWRLPNIKELLSLIDYGNYSPALPDGHPFTVGNTRHYWTSTSLSNLSSLTYSSDGSAWEVGLTWGKAAGYTSGCSSNTTITKGNKEESKAVWPVRNKL